ncbi:MAG: PEGA domain-containing protein [Pirellulaceae bacterium]
MRTRLILLSFLVVTCLDVLPATARVRRRLTIISNPPGAVVFVDDREIGVTPVSTSFTYYGTRKIQLVMEGFETLTVKRTFSPPWYQWPVIDFISENMIRRKLRDERVVDFRMVPQRIVPSDVLLQRAQRLRDRSRQGAITELPAEALNNRPTVPSPVPAPRPQRPPGRSFPLRPPESSPLIDLPR